MKNENTIVVIYSLFLFFSFLYLKLIFFNNLIPGHDQVFYINWIQSLRETKSFLPTGNGTIIENLFSDYESFLNQFFRRFYNNFTTVFASFSLFVFYLLSFFFGANYEGFIDTSILVNSLIPLTVSLLFFSKNNFIFRIAITTLIFLTFFTNFSLFYYSSLGIHNFGVLFFLIALYFFNNNIKKNVFFDKKLVFFGLILPFLSHSINFIILTSLLILILPYRRYYLKIKINFTEILFLTIFYSLIFITCISFLIINSFNMGFIFNFINLNSTESNLNNFLEGRLESFIFLIKNFVFALELIQILILIICFKLKKFYFFKISLLASTIIFTVFSLDNYLYGPFIYVYILLNLIIFLCIKNIFEIYFQNNILKNIVLALIIFNLSFASFSNYNAKNLNSYKKNFFDTYFSSDNELIEEIKLLGSKFENQNVIFNSYLAKHLYYSINFDQKILSDIKALDSYVIDEIYSKDIFKNKYLFYFSENENFDCKKTIEKNQCSQVYKISNPKFKNKQINYSNRKYFLKLYYFN